MEQEPSPDLEEEAALWQRYVADRDPVLRAKLIERYLPTAQKLAAYAYSRRGPQAPEFADYLQWARLGMIEAFDRYDPKREASFVTFAGYRIRGAILNGLERATEQAAQHARRKQIEKELVEAVIGGGVGASEAREERVEYTGGLALVVRLAESERTTGADTCDRD